MNPLLAALALLAGCETRNTELFSDGGDLAGLVSLYVTPSITSLDVTDLAAAQTVPLTAIGHFGNGTEREVTTLVHWSSDPPYLGDVTAPAASSIVWRSSNRAGGVASIAASSGTVAGTATISITLRPVIVDPTAPPPPPIDGSSFDPPKPVVIDDPSHTSRLDYPEAKTMFPVDLAPILFQHTPQPAANGAYRFHFRGPYLDASVLTTADRWQPTLAQWQMIALTTAGDSVQLSIDALDLVDPTTIWATSPVELAFSAAPIGGVISYWSSTKSNILDAHLGDTTATLAYPLAPDTTCVGCHRTSRDGRRLAASYDGKLATAAFPDRAPGIVGGAAASWMTWSPDGTRILTADKGKLELHDASTGAMVPAMGLGGPMLMNATMPDWSPRGDGVALARCSKPDDRDVEACSIVRLGFDGAKFTAPAVLVPSVGMMDNVFSPRFSPDGRAVAFVHADGKSKAAAATASIRLVAATGGAARDLARANRGTGNAMPAWAPSTRPGLQWVAFASSRAYGKLATGPEQIWIAAIDLSSENSDPSFAAFWLPAQDLAARNHAPDWRLDRADNITCTEDRIEVCDGFDNDCDGVIDDDCRPCAAIDICGDNIDNDCDGVIDPGCIR